MPYKSIYMIENSITIMANEKVFGIFKRGGFSGLNAKIENKRNNYGNGLRSTTKTTKTAKKGQLRHGVRSHQIDCRHSTVRFLFFVVFVVLVVD